METIGWTGQKHVRITCGNNSTDCGTVADCTTTHRGAMMRGRAACRDRLPVNQSNHFKVWITGLNGEWIEFGKYTV